MSDNERDSSTKPEKKVKKKRSVHVHIGPNARAYSAGLASCPVCDADQILRLTDREREAEKAVREMKRGNSSRPA